MTNKERDTLREAAELATSLLLETREMHRDHDSPDYNECERDECYYCEQAATAIKGLRALSQLRDNPEQGADNE